LPAVGERRLACRARTHTTLNRYRWWGGTQAQPYWRPCGEVLNSTTHSPCRSRSPTAPSSSSLLFSSSSLRRPRPALSSAGGLSRPSSLGSAEGAAAIRGTGSFALAMDELDRFHVGPSPPPMLRRGTPALLPPPQAAHPNMPVSGVRGVDGASVASGTCGSELRGSGDSCRAEPPVARLFDLLPLPALPELASEDRLSDALRKPITACDALRKPTMTDARLFPGSSSSSASVSFLRRQRNANSQQQQQQARVDRTITSTVEVFTSSSCSAFGTTELQIKVDEPLTCVHAQEQSPWSCTGHSVLGLLRKQSNSFAIFEQARSQQELATGGI